MSCDLISGRLRGECVTGRAGIKTLYFTKYNNYAALTGVTESGGEITSLGASGITLYQFEMESNVGNFEEVANVSRENGTSFIQQTITMTLFNVKPEDLEMLNALKKGRWVVWALDFQDKIRLFGRTRGMTATGGSDVSGAGPGDRKGFDLVLEGVNNDYAIFMADFTTTPFDNFANVVVATTGYIAEYQAVYDSLTTPPSAVIAEEQNAMVSALVTAGTWAKLDIFYLFAQTVNSDSEALKNWINPGTNDCTLVNAPAFVALEGFTGNGSSSYINTNYNPNTDGSNYTLNSACLGIYLRTDVTESTYDLGVQSGTAARIASHIAAGTYLNRINDSLSHEPANTDARGLHIQNRTGASATEIFKNGASVDTDSVASVSVPADDIYICCQNNGGPAQYSTKQVAVVFAGGGLTIGDVTAITNAIETYMDSNGKGVIT
jgi:hypothetical protein